MADERTNRLSWENSEAIALLSAYQVHKDEFSSRKSFHVYEVILEELTEAGALRKARNAEMLHNKIKSLLRSYRTACKDIRQTGTFSMSPMLFNKLDETFGNSKQWAHSINSNYEDEMTVESNHKRQRLMNEPNVEYAEDDDEEYDDNLLEITHETNFNETFNENFIEEQEAEDHCTRKSKKKRKNRYLSFDLQENTESNMGTTIQSMGSKYVFQEKLLDKKIAADIEKERLRHQRKLQYLKMKSEMIDKIEKNKTMRLNMKLQTKLQMHKEMMEKRMKFEVSDE